MDESMMLPLTEHNTSADSTILLIHGGFTSGREWRSIIPHLSTYHLLVPDMPGHGEARKRHPSFSINIAAQLLANLIQQRAKHSEAHVIGFSLGSHVAVELVSMFPDVVSDAFISGYNILPGNNPTFFACSVWLTQGIGAVLPQSFIKWCLNEDDIPVITNRSFAYCRELSVLCTEHWPTAWPARTLIFAAGNPDAPDHASDALTLRDIGRKGNPETVAYTNEAMRHPWNRQDPEVFARTARAWFEKTALPEGFVELHESVPSSTWMLFPR